MPLSPGILWTKNGRRFNKKVMKPGISFGQIQWLNYMQTQCLDSNGETVQIEHEYHRGEVTIEGWQPDGYALVDGEHVFYEYLGKTFYNKSHLICYLRV